MEFNIDILNLGKADATIIWGQEEGKHFVVFLDGGEKRHADVILHHYRQLILPNVTGSPYLVAVNTHMHSDHLGGLQKIVEELHEDMKMVFFNSPTEPLQEGLSQVAKLELLLGQPSSHLRFINESLDRARNLSDMLKQGNIPHGPAVSGTSLLPKPFDQYLRIIGPSPEFYRRMMREAKQPWALEEANETRPMLESVGNDPCVAVAAHQDESPYNKASVIIELTTQQGKKYLFTADTSSPSFMSVLSDPKSGSDLSGYHTVQLPHHGSWCNLDAQWTRRFGAKRFWVSAPGGAKHPRQELVDCIKQTVPDALIYSTHKLPGSWMRFTTNAQLFHRHNTVTILPL